MPPPLLAEYDAAWPVQAEEWIARISAAVRPIAACARYSYQHIGSTAVPGLEAKPIVDLQLLAPELPPEQELAAALGTIGFRVAVGSRPDSPGVRSDTPRPGTDASPGRHAKVLFHRPAAGTAPEIILHVRRSDSPFADFVVRFRDWLRSDTANADAYAAVKRDLAARHKGAHDYDDYTRAKAAFLDEAQSRMGWPDATDP